MLPQDLPIIPNTLVVGSSTIIQVEDYKRTFAIYPDAHFFLQFRDEWLECDLGRRIITEIEQIPLTMPTVKMSIAYYGISVNQISTGAKNLFLCANTDLVGNMSAMGRNCMDILFDIASNKSNGVRMLMLGWVSIPESCFNGRKIYLVDKGVYLNTHDEYFRALAKLESEGVWDYGVDDEDD